MFWRFYFSHIKRQLRRTSQKNNDTPSTKSSATLILVGFTRNDNFSVLHKKITTRYFAHSPRSRAHFTSTHLLPHLLLPSTYYFLLRAFCYACSFLVSASCFSSLLLSTLLLTCSASLAYMYTLHVMPYALLRRRVLRTRPCISSLLRTRFPTVHVYFSSRASWLYYTTALYLYSVLLGRASSAVVLQRLPNIRCLSCLLCTCSTSSRTGIRE